MHDVKESIGSPAILSSVSILHDLNTARTLEEIRARSRQVTEKAPNVTLVRDRIAELAAEYVPPTDGLGAPLDTPYLHLGRGLDTFAYVVVLGSIRFGSGYHKKLAKRADLSVAQTIAAGLSDRFAKHGALTPRELSSTTSADCAAVFGQDLADASQAEVMELFARALRDLGRMLTEQYQGSFESLSAATEGSALRLIEILVQIPFFADVQTYRGLEVPFLLRAQRIAVDLAQAFEGRDLGRFEDLELLAPSADNVIPHVLRTDGVLRYDRGLMERIDRGEPVPAHTEREVEIRASAVDAVERLVADIRARGVATTHVHVDAWLRQRGRHPSYREKPRHRSRTVFY